MVKRFQKQIVFTLTIEHVSDDPEFDNKIVGTFGSLTQAEAECTATIKSVIRNLGLYHTVTAGGLGVKAEVKDMDGQ